VAEKQKNDGKIVALYEQKKRSPLGSRSFSNEGASKEHYPRSRDQERQKPNRFAKGDPINVGSLENNLPYLVQRRKPK